MSSPLGFWIILYFLVHFNSFMLEDDTIFLHNCDWNNKAFNNSRTCITGTERKEKLDTYECIPKVELQRCNAKFEDDPKWIWRREIVYPIHGIAENACQLSTLKYHWTLESYDNGTYLGRFPKFEDKPVLMLNYYALDTGSYVLKLTVSEIVDGNQKGTTSQKCLIKIRPEMPLPQIVGGTSRTVPSDKAFMIEGNISVNMDVAPGKIGYLRYKWSCNATPAIAFCPDTTISKIKYLIVPAHYAINRAIFLFNLQVSTEHSPWFSTEQTVEVKKGAKSIYISCLKNCARKINFRSIIYLQVKCKDCPKDIYEWSMVPGDKNKKKNIDFQSDTAFGKNNPKLVVKEDILVPGDVYTFVAVYDGGNSKASEKIAVSNLPTKGSCKVIPSEGKSLSTLFNITCKNFTHTDVLYYKLFQHDSNTGKPGILLDFNEDGIFTVLLSSASSNTIGLLVRVGDTDGLYVEEELKVTITSTIPTIPTNQQIDKINDEYAGNNIYKHSVNSLITKGEIQKAIQMINALIADVRRISNDAKGVRKFKQNWKMLIIQDLENIMWASQDTLPQIASTIKNLNWEDKDKIDRNFANVATRLCKEVAKKQIENIRESPNKLTMGQETLDTSQDLLWCAEKNMKANMSDLTPEIINFDITTSHPLLTLPQIPENYPNYDDGDLEYAQKLKTYKQISAHAMDIFASVGLAIAKTLSPGEPIKRIDKFGHILQTTADKANILSEKEIGAFDSSVKNQYLASWNTLPAHAVITVYKETPFWWNSETQNFSTHFLDVNYYILNRKLTTVMKPIRLSFKANQTKTIFIRGSVSVPNDLKKWTPEILDYQMTVHRVDVEKGAALRIEFVGLTRDDKIQVMITYNTRPNMQDFQNAKTMSSGNSILMYRFPREILKYGDSWFYVAVLPDQSMIKNSSAENFTFKYTVSFISPKCMYWKKISQSWSSLGCLTGPKTTITQLQCFCNHTSTFSGIYVNAPNKIEPIRDVAYVMAINANYVIFVCVCVVLLLYCLCLIYSMKRKPAGRKVFFLGDNIQNDRYAYLVIVKTGLDYSAGTTSNIGIKIFGEKHQSRAHIINYPDPAKYLLQRGCEDWFVLTAKEHLGELMHIWLWHDSIGLRPAWYCQWVSIKDLQSEQEWFFHVENWFSVLREETLFLTVKPTTKPIINCSWDNWKETIMACLGKDQTCSILLMEKDLTYIQRLTVRLSIVLTTYSVSLILYGTPALRLYDGFGYEQYEISLITILIAFLSSILSYFYNLTFILLFKKTFPKRHSLVTKPLVWTLLCGSILVWLTFLIVFGFWVPYITSLLWISSAFGALAQQILLLENISNVLKGFTWKRKLKNPTMLEQPDVVAETEKQRDRLYVQFGSALLRPYFFEKYQSLTREQWKNKKEQQEARKKISESLSDLLMFIIYVLVLYMVVLANKDALNFYSNQEMENLIYGEFTRTMSLKEVDTIDEFYEYINKTFIRTVHSSNWYGRWEVQEPGLMADFNIKILGVSRFRQLRVLRNCYEIPQKVEQLNVTCYPEFSHWSNDDGDYMEFWMPNSYSYTGVERLSGAWMYKSDSMPSIGELTIYPDSGYSGPLGRTIYNSFYNLKYYQDTEWLDERTRVIFIEFLTYNANYNIFHAVKLIIERSATGLFIKTPSIVTTRLLFVKMEYEIMVALAFVVFVIVLLILCYKKIYIATTRWGTFLKEFWNVVDVVIVTMSFICIAMFGWRTHLVGELLHQLEVNKHNQFLNFFNLTYMEEVLTVLASLLICIATVRLWKLLRFGVIFQLLERTMVSSRHSLFAIATWHLLILLMFSFLGFLLFGTQCRDFKQFSRTLTTLILLSLNLYEEFNFDLFDKTAFGLGYIFYAAYMLTTLTIFTLYIAAIILGYNASCIHYSARKVFYSVQNYISDESRYLQEIMGKKIKYRRMEGGAEDVFKAIPKKVAPKSDEHRYADCITIPTHKLQIMSLIARCVMVNIFEGTKKKSTLSNYKANLMKKTVFHLLTKEKYRKARTIVFTAYDKENQFKMISDYRILKMEYVVNCILDEGTRKNSWAVSFEDDSEKMVFGKGVVMQQLDYFTEILDSIKNVFNNISIYSEISSKRKM